MTEWQQLLALLSAAESADSIDDDCLSVRRLPNPETGWIGCSAEARAAFLLHVSDVGGRPHAISLPSIRARHAIRVLIDDGSSRREEVVSLVECLAEDRASVELFVRCISSLVADCSGQLSGAGLADALDRLVDLFRNVTHATDAEVLGLWSELVIITHCSDPSASIRRWRLRGTSRYDFGTESERLDVKATTSAVRHHEVSFDQTQPPAGVTAAFASMLTERVSTGTSVRCLWELALTLAPGDHHRIDATCVRTLGRDWQIAQEHAYDLSRALSTLHVYLVTDIPRFDHLPGGVIRARFVSDFNCASPWQGTPPTPDGPIASALGCVGSDPRA